MEDYFLSRHPLSGLEGAGIMLHMMRKQFHSFLRTTANIMPKVRLEPHPNSPSSSLLVCNLCTHSSRQGSAVQQEAMQCYYLRFQSQDHSFLLQSNVFTNISMALSFPEEPHRKDTSAGTSGIKYVPLVSCDCHVTFLSLVGGVCLSNVGRFISRKT